MPSQDQGCEKPPTFSRAELDQGHKARSNPSCLGGNRRDSAQPPPGRQLFTYPFTRTLMLSFAGATRFVPGMGRGVASLRLPLAAGLPSPPPSMQICNAASPLSSLARPPAAAVASPSGRINNSAHVNATASYVPGCSRFGAREVGTGGGLVSMGMNPHQLLIWPSPVPLPIAGPVVIRSPEKVVR
ncbi:hypothetical protein CSOJ01_06945 [Colletotrichum sojae]|uniref:Uncharacterized protein n=1 Tax=Colletotrichum sojae TaxID=2175907 RepID=A0A8H6MUD8_9PEZI|nr:hypothetical protein CSOJ01_06945 [Colletotrichum sojae]